MKIHIVQKGDTLWKIAQKYGVDFEHLKKMNGHLSNPDMIMPGMKIKVPTAGVPVKKEAPKKETKINLAPKKEENIEHPYAHTKPFASVNIEAEFSEPIKEEKVNKAPKAVVNEAPKAPIKEAPKAPIEEAPKAPIEEAPKAPIKETPKAPVNEGPKSDNAALGSEEKQFNIPPLSHTIPPVTSNVNINFSNAISNVPPIPPKPENILPGIMKQELESPAEAEAVEEKELASDDTPPELPKAPYVPMMQQPYAMGGAPVAPMPPQPCGPVTPILPGAGYYFPPMPTMPVNYPTYLQPSTYGDAESGSHPFPGIEESSGESGEVPLMPGHTSPTVNPASANMPPFPSYSPASSYPIMPCAPILPVMQGYGWHPAFYPYMPPASYGYYPPAAPAPYPYPAAGTAYPFTQAPTTSAFPRTEEQLFTEPHDEESNDYW
ncbi:SafA/ExsA family spore coat assembly protein [Parageobacillus toebii NBRC 107807]|uniref:Morphogenetic protein associated with SpoVID n=1 Tax=Parageobacillus toebii NBRC 107807 TaxID=1223503 RepID=A0A6G9IYN5_9BACL|nr:SafA/ExsA family spore coat assembly protein [Parageobacillus toebii]MBB3867582.1 morphogenetic protein associated with SpoVID [Parageobacillus toebii NBRC 107807]QIQ31551.1 SafA/ExsA family spore coat assembly protein [Parageobacillus toebii NBRC 107807]